MSHGQSVNFNVQREFIRAKITSEEPSVEDWCWLYYWACAE